MNHEIEKLKIEREWIDKKIENLESDIASYKTEDFESERMWSQHIHMVAYSHFLSERIKIKSKTIVDPELTI